MAERRSRSESIKNGSRLVVTVEYALEDFILVYLEHGSKIFRGALLDSTKRNLPFGIKLPHFYDGSDSKSNIEGSTAVLSPNSGSCEISALAYRHTYMLDKNAVNPKLLPSPMKEASIKAHPLRDRKNIRNMRLRPRQVLCSKCKQGIHDNPVQGNIATLRKETEKQHPNTRSRDNPAAGLATRSSQRLGEELPPQKRKQDGDHMLRASKRGCKPQVCDNENKLGPVIKISFATPRGGTDTVVKIPQRKDYSVPVSPPRTRGSEMPKEHYRKMKKAMKKAKIKKRDKVADQPSTPKVTRPVRHKKSKRSKHEKKRHKRKIMSPPSQIHVSSPDLADESSNQENEVLPVNVIPDDEAPQVQLENQSADDAFEMPELQKEWAKEIRDGEESEHSEGFDEYSITSMDEFSLKKRLKRNIPRNQDDDTNSHGSLDSGCSGNSSTSEHGEGVPGEYLVNNMDATCNFQSTAANMVTSAPQSVPNGDDEALQRLHPLMMKVKEVNMCEPEDGRMMCRGDIVWGKIHGFPWWPGRILSIAVSQGDNGVIVTQTAHVAWFGSSTSSHMSCSELFPFLQEYKLRYNKKKRGPYKTAIKQARLAAQTIAGAEYSDVTDVDLDVLED